MNIRDSLLCDFQYELDFVDFEDDDECEKSGCYMNDQLEIQWNDRRKTDNSLSKDEYTTIQNIMSNVEKYPKLIDAYTAILEVLDE